MKIEMTQSHYADAKGFKLVGAGEHEVDDERGRYLVDTFPSWFTAVEGESGDTLTADGQESDKPEDAQNASKKAKPTKSLSKMNKDELVALADELGIEVNDEMTNKDLREAINNARQAKDGE